MLPSRAVVEEQVPLAQRATSAFVLGSPVARGQRVRLLLPGSASSPSYQDGE